MKGICIRSLIPFISALKDRRVLNLSARIKLRRKDWALVAAFLFNQVFTYLRIAFRSTIFQDPEISRRSFFTVAGVNAIGIVLAALLLPLILPLRDLKEGRTLSRYNSRLILLSLLFLPALILNIILPQFLLTNRAVSVISNMGVGMVTAIMYGLFFTMCTKNRFFWSCLSYGFGFLAYQLFIFVTRRFSVSGVDSVFIFPSVIVLLAVWFFLFIFLTSIPKSKPCEPAAEQALANVTSEKRSPPPAAAAAAISANADTASPKRIYFPACLIPVFACLIIFLPNHITNQLFIPTWNFPFATGFNSSNVIIVFALSVIGFLADRKQKKGFEILLIISSVLLLLSPSLLLFNRSEVLYFLIYTLNSLVVLLIFNIFPFIVIDLFWKQNRGGGYWAWLLGAAVFLTRSVSVAQSGVIKPIILDNPYIVVLLSLTAVVFYVLFKTSINLLHETPVSVSSPNALLIPLMSRQNSYETYRLTPREAEAAELILQGLSNDEIKEKMFVSLSTVKAFVSSIFKKYNVKQRTEFMALFYPIEKQ